MENENDVDSRSLEDIIRKQENSACKRRLRQMGYSERESEMACAALLTLKKDEIEKTNEPDNDFMLLFVDEEDGKPSSECVSRKIKIFHNEHGPGSSDPWSHDKIVAAAHGYCRKQDRHDSVVANIKRIGGSASTSGVGYYGIGRTANISLRKVSSLIKAIKTKGTQKVGAMGIAPFLMSLPQKSLHKLQTKLEKLFTEEQKFLTSEQRMQRAKYATTMKKTDAQEIADIIGEENMNYFRFDDAYFNDEIVIDAANSGLNNIIKAPVILAKELVQQYVFRNEDGSTRSENHFKPFDELSKAINELEQLPMIIEHKDSWEEEEVVGYVKQFVADDKLRAIRGTAYFYENRLPQVLIDNIKSGLPIAVSIGFMAELGGSGLFNGLIYEHTQENIILEHLAICLESLPRCSIDQCGVNLGDKKDTIEEPEFTIINKGSYYYNINNLIDIEETRINKQNTDNKIKSDNMTEDSFPDPKSGEIAGDEPHYFEVMLKRMRKYIHGESEFIDPNFAKKKIQEIIQHLTDEEEETETLQGEDNMEEKEFEDAIAKKDEEIEILKEIVKDSLIKEIRSFTDAKTQEKLKLEDKCVKELRIVRDTVAVFEPIKEEADVLPIESKEEKLEEMKDAGIAPTDEPKKYKKVRDEGDYLISDMFADVNEEFEEGSFILSA